ncbi:Asp23/Gls24 family envelope stress response protein [Corynebacterium sp. CCM 9204]|uniref:Asp23/Gls24 family envelope stress response protein n=1 Tax=Corynebacterium sp. CCM 9204 TaxID=3057616 RepID=UPI00352330A5
MTKRSGRSRPSKRRSPGSEASANEEKTSITPEPTDAETVEARLRAEAERRADEALIEIAREDAKVDEDRRILRENGILVDGDKSATGSGDAAAREDTTSTSPETFSSETPAPKESPENPELSGDQVSPNPSALSTHQELTSEPRVSKTEDRSMTARSVTTDDSHTDHPENHAGSSESNTFDDESGDNDLSIAPDIEGGDGDSEDAGSSPAGESPDSEAETSSQSSDDNHGSETKRVAVPERLAPPDEPEDDNPSRGWVKISEKTVTKIVRQAAASVPGTTEHSGGLDVLGRGYPRFDVELDSNSDAVSIDAYVAVIWPSPVTRVAETVRTAIFDWIRDMTDIPVVRVNVTVGPIVPGGERVTEAELMSFDTTPPLRPVVVTARNASLDEVRCSGEYENLREIVVQTGNGELAPIRVSESDHCELREIEVAPGGDLAPISAAEPKDLRTISVTGEAATSVFSPTVSSDTELRPITVPKAQPLKEISLPAPTPLREISSTELPTYTVAVPPARQVISVRVPDAPEPRSVELPHPAPLRKVETPKARRLRRVHAPDTHRLAQIHAEAPRVSPVKQPTPARVRPVKRNPLQVDKKPRVDKRVDRVRSSASGTPPTPKLKELRPITVKRTTIIPVHVDPANAKAVLRDE